MRASGRSSSVSGWSLLIFRRATAWICGSSTEQQQAAATEWIERLGIADLRDRIFSQLSYGERRLVIIVRALVKNPELLALDEPCQGLDPANRRRVLSMVDCIAFDTPTQILYVTHRRDEMPRCITNVLRLG